MKLERIGGPMDGEFYRVDVDRIKRVRFPGSPSATAIEARLRQLSNRREDDAENEEPPPFPMVVYELARYRGRRVLRFSYLETEERK